MPHPSATPPEAPIPAEVIEAIRRDAEHFPPYVRSRGLDYWERGRVGALEIGEGHVRAAVRGSRTYRTGWHWSGAAVDPRCTCPVGPVCKHAYAVALAATRGDHALRPAVPSRTMPSPVPPAATPGPYGAIRAPQEASGFGAPG